MRTKLLTVLGVASLLAGCASTPAVSYWNNPQWVNALGKTVHKNIQYPKDAVSENFPSGTAIVEFTYDGGKLQAPHILKSTGSKWLDAEIVEQIQNIKPPQAQGLNAGTPHDFEMEVGLYPDHASFFNAIRQALATHIRNSHIASHNRGYGMLLAGFKYKNGEILDPRIVKSSGNPDMDQSVLHEMTTTPLPKPPVWLKDRTLNLTVLFCFESRSRACQNTEIQVRYVPVGEEQTPNKPPCAEVGYRYADGRISNVHLVESSGDPTLDKHALLEASEGKFPRPTARWDRAINDYTVPVCNYGGSGTAASKAVPH